MVLSTPRQGGGRPESLVRRAKDFVEAAKDHQLRQAQQILDSGASVDPLDPYVTLCFLEAAYEARTKLVEDLLDQGMPVDASIRRDRVLELRHYKQGLFEDNHTALMLASRQGHAGVADLLLSRGAEVNARSDGGATALLYASSNAHSRVVRVLLNRGADVNAQDESGQSALMEVFHRDNDSEKIMEIVTMLLAAGANLNLMNDHYETALVYAVQGALAPGVRLLLAAGADPNLERPDGRNPAVLSVAVTRQKEVFDLLMEAGAVPRAEYVELSKQLS
jgi:uncharacterized protein